MANENAFQASLVKELESRYEGCIVMKNDPNYIQGIPDLLIVHGDRWAALECKKSKDAKHQPNQDDYICQMNNMSYASFIYPENKDQVLEELDKALSVKKRRRRK